ncbi:MAG TPA: glycosyltransferase N-terminal domain-containing protein [Gemmatimonadales bacterium]
MVSRGAAQSMAGRINATTPWLSWHVPRRGPLVWVHAASVGEALTASPILARLRVARPEIASMLTFTSPSVERWPGALGCDRAGYLPPDDRTTMDALFRHLRPAALVFARGDLWPGLVAAAKRHGVPVLLVGGAVGVASTRLRLTTRLALRPTYSAVDWSGGSSPADANRLRRLGVRAVATHVTGDPRHDQAVERPVALRWPGVVLAWAAGDPLMVAGSTHPEDERVLLSAFRRVLTSCSGARLLVVPHTTHCREVERLRQAARVLGLAHATLEADVPSDARLLIGSRLGTLADLYLAANVAYLGGGFTRAGLHAVVEPAAFGVPVIFGARTTGHLTADAAALLAAGGGWAVYPTDAVTTLADRWLRWLGDHEGTCLAGLAGRGTLTTGAATVSARAILSYF